MFHFSAFFMNAECEPCLKNWIPFQEKCYLFYEDKSLLTWGESQQHCQKANADLVVIDSLQEQVSSSIIKTEFLIDSLAT